MSTSAFSSFPSSEDEESEQNFKEMPEDTVEEREQVDEPMTDAGQLSPPATGEKGLPPEAEGETNGGPLGCCLGVTVGLMLSLFLGLIGFGHVLALGFASVSHADLATNIRIATGILGVIGAFVGGYAGWKIGRRIYREYELSPRQKEKLARLEERYRSKL